MKPIHSVKTFLLVAVVLIATLAGCGKVTQTSSKTSTDSTFDLKFTVATVATADPIYKTASYNYFPAMESPVHTVVYGIGKSGKNQELSWGKALLALKPSGPTSPTLSAKVTAFRKGDIELETADYSWAKLNFDPNTKQWAADVRKLKLGYPMYLIAFYTPKGKAYLSIIDNKRVSGNGILSLAPLTAYDTFIATLILEDLQDQKGVIEATVSPGELKAFFTTDFFDLLNYRLPLSTATKFNPENPSFVYARELEKRLLALYGLWQENEMEEGVSLLEKYRKDNPNWLSPKAELWWISRFKELK